MCSNVPCRRVEREVLEEELVDLIIVRHVRQPQVDQDNVRPATPTTTWSGSKRLEEIIPLCIQSRRLFYLLNHTCLLRVQVIY